MKNRFVFVEIYYFENLIFKCFEKLEFFKLNSFFKLQKENL